MVRWGAFEEAFDFAGEAGELGQAIAGVLLEGRLVVEGVHLADAAGHVHEDAVLGLAREMLRLDSHGIDEAGRIDFVGQHAGEGQAADAIPGPAQEISSREGHVFS